MKNVYIYKIFLRIDYKSKETSNTLVWMFWERKERKGREGRNNEWNIKYKVKENKCEALKESVIITMK